MLRAYPRHLAFWSVRKLALELGHQRSKVFQAIGRRLKNDHGDGELRELLLKGQVAVNRHKDIELFLRTPKQLTVLDTSPAGLRNRDHFMAINLFGQSMVDTLVKKNLHEATASIRALASSRKAITCSRETVGNPSRNSSMV